MAAGRCAGCGKPGQSKAIDKHILSCPSWAELYRQFPEKALGAEQEHRRWSEEDRAADHQDRIAVLRAETDGRRASMATRFRRVDPLEEGDEDDGVG
jgi:hypothetical protein